MLKKLMVGAAAVSLTLGMAVPTPAPPKVADDHMTIMTPGIICWWFGWC